MFNDSVQTFLERSENEIQQRKRLKVLERRGLLINLDNNKSLRGGSYSNSVSNLSIVTMCQKDKIRALKKIISHQIESE